MSWRLAPFAGCAWRRRASERRCSARHRTVLHHAGPLAGAALFAGLGGTLLFGALGLVAATPLLLKTRRRTGSWRAPAAAPALFTTLFARSSFVVAPALTGAEDDPGRSLPETAPQLSDDDHGVHHP